MFNKFFTDVVAMLVPMIGLIMEQDLETVDGASKKSVVVANMEKLLDEPGGLDWPQFLPGGSTRTWLLGFLVDRLVNVAKKTGFFGK